MHKCNCLLRASRRGDGLAQLQKRELHTIASYILAQSCSYINLDTDFQLNWPSGAGASFEVWVNTGRKNKKKLQSEIPICFGL